MKNIYGKNYTQSQSGYQLLLPLNLDSIIPSDDKVRLLSQFVEELDLTDFYRTYGWIRKSSATPRQMFKLVYNGKVSLRTLKILYKKLSKIGKEEKVEFVHGPGKRKSQFQKTMEELVSLREKLKEYVHKIHVCGSRNSYSKTDPDATFMRMKEVHMGNGQLKPAYNLQHGVDSEYIVWLTVGPQPTDTTTLRPFIQGMESHLSFKYTNIVADAGYESEENYLFLESNGQMAFIKPANYEKSKTRKFKNDVSRLENMSYDQEKNLYSCAEGKELSFDQIRNVKTKTGYTVILHFA